VVCLVVIPMASEAPKEAMMIPPIINSVIGLTSLTLLIFVVPSLLKITPLNSDKVVK